MADTSWHSDAYPELRSGPPWVMQEMIAAQPFRAEQMLSSPSPAASAIADEIASALASARPITVTGCGTSEHAAHAIASLTAAAAPERRALIRGRPALSAAIDAARERSP
jgi:fructoselysine-6-P-deglycase FrlB-like protein